MYMKTLFQGLPNELFPRRAWECEWRIVRIPSKRSSPKVHSQAPKYIDKQDSPPNHAHCAYMFRHQSDFLSASQSVSRVFLETDWGAIFQCKFSPRNMRNAHGSGGNPVRPTAGTHDVWSVWRSEIETPRGVSHSNSPVKVESGFPGLAPDCH